MALSATELNRIADEIVAGALNVYVHTGSPGVAGSSNRVTGVAAQVAAASSWSNASAGDVQYNADLEFGVLSSSTARTVSHYSIFRAAAFVASEELDAAVAVSAGGTFKINTGTIRINGATS